MLDCLPDPFLITEPAKAADMFCISSKSLCGGNDFTCARLKEGRFSAGKAGGHWGKRSRHGLDSETLPDPLDERIDGILHQAFFWPTITSGDFGLGSDWAGGNCGSAAERLWKFSGPGNSALQIKKGSLAAVRRSPRDSMRVLRAGLWVCLALMMRPR
jgi:hypothetical protein